MAITKINTTNWANINIISGVNKSSIVNVSGSQVSPPGPTCTNYEFGYSDGRRTPPESACSNPLLPYDFDETNQLLYISGGCGSIFAIAGYYSDGRMIFFWDGAQSWSQYGPCGR